MPRQRSFSPRPRNAFGTGGDVDGCSGFSVDLNNVVPTGPLESILETAAGAPALGSFGGSTPTVRVPINSPTINQSDVSALPNESAMNTDLDQDGADNSIDVDQRGAPRVVGVAPDMGATVSPWCSLR